MWLNKWKLLLNLIAIVFNNNRNKFMLTSGLIGDVPPFRYNMIYIKPLVTTSFK